METYLFFGSFNPFHNGHYALARYILDNTGGELWFIVSPQNPHKDPSILVPFDDRFNMVSSAAKELGDRVKACDIENLLTRPSYTIQTVEKLKELYPKKSFILLAGSDIEGTIHTWHRYNELQGMIPIMIYPRKEEDRDKSSAEFKNGPVLEISSTDIRETGDLSHVPLSVADYIRQHKLYGI